VQARLPHSTGLQKRPAFPVQKTRMILLADLQRRIDSGGLSAKAEA
jgi:hypothetical protein